MPRICQIRKSESRIIFVLLLLILSVLTWAKPSSQVQIQWDPGTIKLIQAGGLYGRIIRLKDKSLLCGYEQAGKCWVRVSKDNAKTWQPPVLVVSLSYAGAANPEILQTTQGNILLFFNQRPHDGVHPFAICMTMSADSGATWTSSKTIYEAGIDARNGCWEPAAIQLPSGEIQLFFANNYPHKGTNEQEISLSRSQDEGRTWTQPQAVSFRAGHRDGMPSPLRLTGNQGIAVAIEDNGLPSSAQLQPAIFVTVPSDNWQGPYADAASPRRWGAVVPALTPTVYAGAPCLRQLPSGETLLSCQSNEGSKQPRMVVYVGDKNARNFTSCSIPFDLPDDVEGMWNALFIKDAHTVMALSSTTIHGVRGLWSVEGHVVSLPTTTLHSAQ